LATYNEALAQSALHWNCFELHEVDMYPGSHLLSTEKIRKALGVRRSLGHWFVTVR
jgi:hypothetical protein